MKALKDDGFLIKVIKSVYPDVYMCTVDLDIQDLCYEAELLKVPMRLEDENIKRKFLASQKEKYSGF